MHRSYVQQLFGFTTASDLVACVCAFPSIPSSARRVVNTTSSGGDSCCVSLQQRCGNVVTLRGTPSLPPSHHAMPRVLCLGRRSMDRHRDNRNSSAMRLPLTVGSQFRRCRVHCLRICQISRRAADRIAVRACGAGQSRTRASLPSRMRTARVR